jgi:hypothetical protein
MILNNTIRDEKNLINMKEFNENMKIMNYKELG